MFAGHHSDDGRIQPLLAHLTETAARAGQFATVFNGQEWATLAAMAHDIGKYAAPAQRRILKNGPRVDHSTAGAQQLMRHCEKKPMLGKLLAYCAAGHHAGLLDGGTPSDNGGCPTLQGRLHKQDIPDFSAFADEVKLPPIPRNLPLNRIDGQGFSLAFFVRMLFSCLVDADFLDTEAFMSDKVKAAFALNISLDGELLGVIPLQQQVQQGKRTIDVAQEFSLPQPVVRSSGVCANFLCDNAAYLLGIDLKKNNNNPERARQCFAAAKDLHCQLLRDVESVAAQSICAFFEHWKPEAALAHPILQPYLEQIGSTNLVFWSNATQSYAHLDAAITYAWDLYCAQDLGAPQMRCLVTGETAPIAILHNKIKGVRGAQTIGASLVSFNALAYESHGHSKDQGRNAPVSEYAAFAYISALNALLSDKEHCQFLGETTVVYWAKDADPEAQDLFKLVLDSPPLDQKAIQDVDLQLKGIFEKMARGDRIIYGTDIDQPFYVLGLAPNAARVSVRFFLRDTVGHMLQNLQAHYERLEIAKAPFEPEYLSLPALLQETVNSNSREKTASPLLAGAVLRAILSGMPYPRALYIGAMLRVRAEQDSPEKHTQKVSRGRAAILKAYLSQTLHHPSDKEVLTVALNEQSTNRAYVLGRLFAVLEKAQLDANRDINTTIKDRYFTAACATPKTAFPTLLRLSMHHISKSEYGYITEQQIAALMDKLEIENDPFPATLALEDQGLFILGYYHQFQARFAKKAPKTKKAKEDV